MLRPNRFTLFLAGCWMLVFSSLSAPAQILYQDWQGGYAWPSVEASAPEADPDGDGITNLIEYAIGSNPLSNAGDVQFLPRVVNDTAHQPVFRFYRNTAFTDIDYVVETSTDLKNWTAVSDTLVEVIVQEGTWQTCIVRVPSGEKARFYRVRVSYNPESPGTEPGRESYDPSQGIGTVITPNPFLPDADLRIPKGEGIDPGIPDFGIVTGIIDRTKSDLWQSAGWPHLLPETNFIFNTQTFLGESGGTAKIGSYTLPVQVGSKYPFSAENWERVLDRANIYNITLDGVKGVDWNFGFSPARFTTAWTSYEKTIGSRRLAEARYADPTDYQPGWQSGQGLYLMEGKVEGSGRLIGDLADASLSSNEKNGIFSMYVHAHAYGGNGITYPRSVPISAEISVGNKYVMNNGALRHSSDINFDYEADDKFRYTALSYEYKEFGGDKGLIPGREYDILVEFWTNVTLTTQHINNNYVPETRPTADHVEVNLMGGLKLPANCVVKDWEIERGSYEEVGPNEFIFKSDYKEEDTRSPVKCSIRAKCIYMDGSIILTTGADETSGARYRKVGLNGQPLPDGKPQSEGETDQQPEETFVDAMTLQLRHQTSDAYTAIPTSDLSLEVRRNVHSEVWSHRFGLRPDERTDLPFGVGWSSNLSPGIRFEDSYGTSDNPPSVPTATVTDEQGSSYRFLVEQTANGYTFTPFPTAKHEQSAYLCKLEKVGNEYHFTRKFGTKLIYQKVDGAQTFPSDRMVQPITHEDIYTYARLLSVEDRLGNVIDYSYASEETVLIPSQIKVRGREGLKIDIRTSDGVITDIWDANGFQTSYRYSKLADGVRVLDEVIYPDGEKTQYTYNLATDADRRPKSGNAEKPDPDFTHYHCDLETITDAEARVTRFEYRYDRSKDDYSVRNGYYPKTGLPRNVYKTHLPNGEVGAVFTNESRISFYTEGSAEDVNLMGDSRRQNSVTASPDNPNYSYTRTYQWSDPVLSVVKVPPRLFGNGPIPPSPILVYYRKMDLIMPEIGTETFVFNPDAGLALKSATDLSGNMTQFVHDDPVSDDAVNAYNDVFVGKNATSSGRVYFNSYYDDTTRQIDANAGLIIYEYNTKRLLEKITDQLGRVTKFDFDERGRRWRERVFENDSSTNPVREVRFTYGSSTFPGFATRKTIVALDGNDTDIVTAYTPDAYGRIASETIDPDNLALTTHYEYSIGGDLLSQTDAKGYKTAFAYDKQHRLIGMFFPNNTAKTFEYDRTGNKVAEIDERGNVTSHVYDALNRVAQTTRHMNGDVPDIVTGQKYNPLNQPEEYTDARGYKTLYAYDKIGRLARVTTPTVSTDNGSGAVQTGVLVTTCSYDGDNAGGSVFATTPIKPTSTINTRGYESLIIYDDLYRAVETRAEYAPGQFATKKTDYDGVGNAYRITDELGKVREIDFDALNRPYRTKEPDGGIRLTTYNTTGLITKTTDELNRVTVYEYDTGGRLIKTIYPAIEGENPTLINEYDANNNIVATTDARGNRTEIVFDALNRKTWVAMPEILDTERNVYARPILKTEYDEAGNVVKETDARGNETETQFDASNRPTKTISPSVYVLDNHAAIGESRRLESIVEYDANGNIVKTTDHKGNITVNVYDSLNRLTSTKDAENQTVFFRYDSAGNKTVVIDAKGNATRFTYDGLNRNLSTIDAKGAAITYGYDAKNRVKRTDAQNRETLYSYDDCHRLKTVSYSGRSQDNLVHVYDRAGNLLSVTTPNDATGTRDVAYTYDDGNNLKTELSGRGANAITHRYFYDLFGNRIKTIYGGTNRELVSTYDAHNRLETLTESGRTTTYLYDRCGNVIEKKLPNGDVTRTTYDGLNRKVTIATGNGINPLQHFLYMYDAIGNVARIDETYRDAALNRVIKNTYDKTHRLVKEAIAGAEATETVYAYDAANNRTVRTIDGVPTLYEYNELNQIVGITEAAGVASIAYDADGNRTSRTKGGDVTAYTYDFENRLVTVTEPSKTHSYTYDSRTRRVVRQEGIESSRVVFSDGTSYAEYAAGSSQGAPAVEYMRGSDYGGGIGGILYTIRSGTPSFTHYNNRGDVTAKTDGTGAATYQAIYEAFGTRPLEIGGTLDRQKANTKDEDPTGLLNEGLRYRDLETGTFLTRDPMGFVDGPNLYAYVMQNPWTSFDPHGLEAMDDMKSFAWGRSNEQDGKASWEQDLKSRNAMAAGVMDTVVSFFSYTAALIYEGSMRYGPTGTNSLILKGLAPEMYKEFDAHIDLATKEMVQQPRNLVSYITNTPDDEPLRNATELGADILTLAVGAWKIGAQAPKYFKAAKLWFMEAKTVMSIAAKERKGIALVQKIKGLKDWWMKGSEHDAAWRKLSLKDKFFHEIGNNTHVDDIYRQYEGVSNSVAKGKLIWKEQGAFKATFSSVRGMLFLGAGSTLPTGPTSLVRWAVPRFAGPVGYAAYHFYSWWWDIWE